MSAIASGISITRGCDNNARGTEKETEKEKETEIGNESESVKGKGKEIHERRKSINAMDWVISTQLFRHLHHASLMTGPRMSVTLILR